MSVSKLKIVFVELELNPAVYKLVVVIELDTAKLLRRPTLVMFGCAPCETTRATLALATFPTRFDELSAERPDPLADTFATEIIDGKSEFTSDRNVGAAVPTTVGPANMRFWATVVTPTPPDPTAKGVVRVRVSIMAPCDTVKAYPGLDVV